MDKEIDKNTTVELVPARDGSWIPTPPLRRNPAARAARVWLRECVNPTAPSSYLGPGELCLIRTHLHWLVPARAIVSAAAMMPLAILLGVAVPSVWWLQLGLGLAAVAHQGFLFYRFLAWRTEQIIVTDQRIIRTAGVFTTTVDAVNLDQITDSTYHRSFLGHLFNYGTVRIGSAGQRQALESIDFCPDPAAVYRATLPDSDAAPARAGHRKGDPR